jgi:hypothetical protein
LKSTDYLNVTLDSLLEKINLDEVKSSMLAVHGADKLSPFEFREISDCVLLAADTWLARDLQTFSSIKVEESYNNGKVFIDLIGVNKGGLAPFNKYPDGSLVMIDWKSSANPVDTDTFKKRHLGSYQWQKYASCEPSTVLFIYRGLSRSLDFRKKGDNFEPASRTRELILQVHDGIFQDVLSQWSGVAKMRNALITSDMIPWPKNRDSCYDYGYDCPFLKECFANQTALTMPTFSDNLSYSKMSLFLRCPERYRLTTLAEQTDATEIDEDMTTLAGSIIHAGLANLWQQSFENR